ncbi:MAG TPA: COX15/CtaA family protein [Thermohalobaculum sp.]|nr:COX15/CtaA family protein [Thermohalobaculum sp.]
MSKRAVFEEVGPERTRRDAPPPPPARKHYRRSAIALWLWVLAALVAIMVLVGGATRLTDSGLSITVWDPVMGAVPPLSAEDWDAAFAAYRQTTEYQEQNAWMTLEDFKPIYWWEWGHRFLGRLIGLVWLGGLLVFLALRAIPPGWTGRLVLPGLLGAVQGAIGWWMVSSGLTGRLDVASYRLALHLGLAFAIFALLVWLARKIRLDEVATLKARRQRLGPLVGLGGALAALVFLQVLVGALVAGIDAGRGYVDWPLMQGQVLPDEAFELTPVWRNLFESPALTQFVHRVLGYVVLAVGLWFAWRCSRSWHRRVRSLGLATGGAVVLQVVIGIATVMHASPLGLALLHQAGALAVVGLLFFTKFEAAYPAEQRIARR